jgi:hypothetical protein
MAIRSVIGKSWGPSPECAKWSWTAVIRTTLTYGAIVWSRTASQSWAKKKLQRVQRMALSQISHVRPSTLLAALEIVYGVPPLDLFTRNCAQNAAIQVKQDTSWQPPAKAKDSIAHGRHLQHQFPPGYGRQTPMRSPMKTSCKRTTQSNSPQKKLTCCPALT